MFYSGKLHTIMGKLTTHILDTERGKPAAGMKIELWRVDESPSLLTTRITNSDGRVDSPILSETSFTIGTYELRFFAGDYLRTQNADLPEPLFLDIIPIRFGIANSDQHYHVPLLLSAHSYSTYRGS
jgi:5-hydroxyisourate hydrolase